MATEGGGGVGVHLSSRLLHAKLVLGRLSSRVSDDENVLAMTIGVFESHLKKQWPAIRASVESLCPRVRGFFGVSFSLIFFCTQWLQCFWLRGDHFVLTHSSTSVKFHATRIDAWMQLYFPG